MAVTVPVSWGELIDKITILELKSERLTDPAKLDMLPQGGCKLQKLGG